MPPSRFGESKYRNSVTSFAPRDTWYRSRLPPQSDAPPNTSAYSSVIKTSRQWIITVSPSGDASIRGYNSVAEKDGGIWAGKVSSGVSDWDLGQLEGGDMVVAGTDGSVHYYSLGETLDAPETRFSFHTSSPVTGIRLHPTTPGIVLASSAAHMASIYDLSVQPKIPTILLGGAGEKSGMWSTAWSADGCLVGGVSKNGKAYMWDVRASGSPIQERSLSIQPLKPARIAWVGQDLFLTSFSRTRHREYSLLSARRSLASEFSNVLDNSQGPLVPIVDEERRIIYAAGRGDMTMRQIELSGPMGFQETSHVLPFHLQSGSLAFAHWSTLSVMEATIANVIIPIADKDGDALIPVSVKVPRRQLIDYHADLYPDAKGSIPAQSAATWLTGGDAVPQPVSVDPKRRSEWEQEIKNWYEKPSCPKPMDETIASTGRVTVIPSIVDKPAPSSSPELDENVSKLPPLRGKEDYISSDYKARVIGHYIYEYYKAHRTTGARSPVMVGFQGPQGCGKTTLCRTLVQYLGQRPRSLRTAVLSLDDLYLPHSGLTKLAKDHPNNTLLSGRGPPGTHDIDLAVQILKEITHINEHLDRVNLPIFDKSLCDGEGDRSDQKLVVQGPIDLFILEGWSFGFGALTKSVLESRYAAADGKYFPKQPLESLVEINNYLAKFAEKVYPFFTGLIHIQPKDYDYVFRWRLEQEHAMKSANGGRGMTDEEVHNFIERYMPAYELWSGEILAYNAPWKENVVTLTFGENREVTAVEAVRTNLIDLTTPSKSNSPAPTSLNDDTTESVSGSFATENPTSEGIKTELLVPNKTSGNTKQSQPPLPVEEKSLPTAKVDLSSEILTISTATAHFNPGWSRKYINAKSPLLPTYDQVPTLATLRQDSSIFKCTLHLAYFPIQGPGGRLCVQPLSRKGRIPIGGVGYLSSGSEIADFAVESIGDRVAIAGEDGVVRIWSLGPEGIEGAGPAPSQSLRGEKIDKIVQVSFHPTAKDLLIVATNDFGKSAIRFFDLTTGNEEKRVVLDVGAIYNFVISSEGDKMALATKDSRVVVLDPRDPTNFFFGPAYNSPRSFRLAWVDDKHIVSTGFARGSVRTITLHRLDGSEIVSLSSITVDVSPAVQFPVYDPDTNLLYVWGKGERGIQAYEVHPETTHERIAKLEMFATDSPQVGIDFMPKSSIDVRGVEVARALRLTAKTIEEVTYKIPRNKPEYFQDDIFVPTWDVTVPVTSAAAWLAGENIPPRKINLRPSDMPLLSQAPQTSSAAKSKFVPAANVMSEEEKRQQEMDALFRRAKIDDSSDEDDEPPRSGLAPPDDDW